MASRIRAFNINNYMMHVVSCSDIIHDQEVAIINDLDKYSLLENILLGNRDTKKVFYFHIIKGICEYIEQSLENKSHVFYYSPCDLKFLELTEYVDRYRVLNFLNTLTKHLMNLLPVKFYTSDVCFDTLEGEQKSGEVIEHMHSMRDLIKYKCREPGSTSRMRSFLSKNEFNYLNEKYFSRYKQAMFFINN